MRDSFVLVVITKLKITIYILHHDSVPTSHTAQFDSIRDKLFTEMVVYARHVTTINLILYVKPLPHNLTHQLHTSIIIGAP